MLLVFHPIILKLERAFVRENGYSSQHLFFPPFAFINVFLSPYFGHIPNGAIKKTKKHP
jgi:hypothetical protein